MKKSYIAAVAMILLVPPALLYAGGGGGVDYLFNVGPDLLPSVQLPNGSILVWPTDTLSAVSAYGYGVTKGGWKIGGFALFMFSGPLAMSVPGIDGPVTNAFGAFGGVISGGQIPLGPFRLSLNFRAGPGVIGIRYQPVWSLLPSPYQVTTFALMGGVDLEIGLLFVPAMMLSAYAGVDGLVAVGESGPVPAATAVAGIRVTWGRF